MLPGGCLTGDVRSMTSRLWPEGIEFREGTDLEERFSRGVPFEGTVTG